MSLTLTLEPILEERLRLEAEQRGLSVELWLAQELEQRFQTTGRGDAARAHHGRAASIVLDAVSGADRQTRR